jgi:CRISPR-associated protein Cas2
MVVFSLSNAPHRTRGLISRYCPEIRPGLFIGRLDRRMRMKLWDAILEEAGERTSAVMAWSRPTAQGYAFRSHGPNARRPVHYDGLWLVAQRAGDRSPDPKPDAV